MKILDREITMWLAGVAAVFQVLAGYGLDLDGHVQGIVNAVIVFVFAVAVAIKVGDGIIAMVSGIIAAGFALFSAFGLEWSPEHQTNIIAAVVLVGGFFVRRLVTAPVGPQVSPPGKLVDNHSA